MGERGWKPGSVPRIKMSGASSSVWAESDRLVHCLEKFVCLFVVVVGFFFFLMRKTHAPTYATLHL